MATFRRELFALRTERFVEGFYSKRLFQISGGAAWEPLSDVCEVQEYISIIIDLAGVDPGDIRVSMDEDVLTVEGIRKDPCPHEKIAVYQMEIDKGPFEKRFIIQPPIDKKGIKVTYKNGFLHIKLPKKET
jgi:HSP20 family protein